NFIRDNTKLCFFLSLVVIAGLAPGLSQFREKYDVRIWFRETDPLIKTLNSFERQFGNDESVVVVMHAPGGVFKTPVAESLREITEEMWKIPEVIRVESLSNYNYSYAEEDDIIVEPFFYDPGEPLDQEYLNKKKGQALSDKVLPNYLVSEDGNAAMIFARLAPTLGGSPNYETILNETKKLVAKYKDRKDIELHIIGEAAVNDAFRQVANDDGKIFLPMIFIMIILYLLLTFRSFIAMLLPLGVTIISLVTTFGFAFYLGFTFNNIMSILPAILIAISIADSVHVLVTYFNFRGGGYDNKEAAYMAIHKNLIPTFLTSVSTMIGFFSLTPTELVPVRELGTLAGVGCFFAWAFTVFFMTPLLFWLPFKVPKHFVSLTGQSEDGVSPFSVKLTNFLDRNKEKLLIAMVVFTIGSLYAATKINMNSNPYEYFNARQPIRKANDFVKKVFGGNTGPEFVIDSGKEDGIKDPEFLRKVEKFKLWVDAKPYVNKTVDIIDIVKDMNKNLYGGKEEEYRLPDGQKQVAEQLFLYSMSLPQGMDLNNRMTLKKDKMRMSVLWSIYDTRGWLKHIDEMEQKGRELGLNIEATGKFYLFQRMMDYVVLTFVKSITMAMLLVAILMMLIFRSFKIGLISLIPNVLPLVFGGAIMAIAQVDLNIGSALVFSVCLGIAVDDTIHFLTNYYRLKKEGMEEKDIMGTIFTYTGSALVVTTVILASGFGIYYFGDFVPNENFGMLCAFVLTGALLIDMFFLPALLMWLNELRKKSES
ncbi:MAG: MMPL family transporter, partial [Halobacteriovoraceae bacterium]|nr:MMPL family transporter [Halobacteriovoraceae bacterium]